MASVDCAKAGEARKREQGDENRTADESEHVNLRRLRMKPVGNLQEFLRQA